MKNTARVILVAGGLVVVGCAQKTETEKLADQFKKTGKEWERDSQKTAKEMTRETQRMSEKLKKEMEEVQ